MLELVDQGSSGVKRMRLRRDCVCSCGAPVAAGTAAGWDVGARVVVCPGCLGAPDRHEVSGPPQPTQGGRRVDAAPDGRAGGSAQAEYERRKARRERRVREAHPRIGGFLLAVTSEPQSTRAWASGAAGGRRGGGGVGGLSGGGGPFVARR